MSRLHFARVLFVLLLIVSSTAMLQAQSWEAYAFAGGTTHSGNVFKDTFTVGNTTFENKDQDARRLHGRWKSRWLRDRELFNRWKSELVQPYVWGQRS